MRSEDRFKKDLETGEVRIIQINGKWTVHFKQREPLGKKPRTLLTEVGTTSNGSDELKEIFGTGNVFQNPKPTTLIKYLIGFKGNRKDIVVLDFFAGSGTTGQAVLELNKEDNGNRNFIIYSRKHEYFA